MLEGDDWGWGGGQQLTVCYNQPKKLAVYFHSLQLIPRPNEEVFISAIKRRKRRIRCYELKQKTSKNVTFPVFPFFASEQNSNILGLLFSGSDLFSGLCLLIVSYPLLPASLITVELASQQSFLSKPFFFSWGFLPQSEGGSS